jgi:hypothetical protein
MFFVLGLGMLLIWLDHDKEISAGRAFYYAVITGTTIGYARARAKRAHERSARTSEASLKKS